MFQHLILCVVRFYNVSTDLYVAYTNDPSSFFFCRCFFPLLYFYFFFLSIAFVLVDVSIYPVYDVLSWFLSVCCFQVLSVFFPLFFSCYLKAVSKFSLCVPLSVYVQCALFRFVQFICICRMAKQKGKKTDKAYLYKTKS